MNKKTPVTPPQLSSFDHLVLTVVDLSATLAFYRDVLGMIPEEFTPSDGSTRWALKFGAQKINLHVSGAEFEPCAVKPTPGSADLCFLSEVSLERWAAHLADQGVGIELGPIRRTGARSALRSLYLRDPDGNLIEVSNRLED
jgi:catechol 2,3-dioxygenase-like lactoylglutathione lyase family enzyme